MTRWKVAAAIVVVAGVGVLAVASISGAGDEPASQAATTLSDPAANLVPDATTSLPADPVGVPSSERAAASPDDDTPNSATQTAPATTTTMAAPTEESPAQQTGGAIDERDRAEVAEATDELLVEVLPLVAEVDANEPIDVLAQLGAVASEALLSEFEAERLEFEAEGWSRSGAYRVDGIEVLDHSESGESASATVRACLDASGIVVRRADGSVVEPGEGSQRAWNVFVLERTGENWRLVGRRFTDDPAC